MFNQIDFGGKLRALRKQKNITQKEIALKIGVSEQAVSKWENGECLPDVYNLKLLGQLLQTSIDSLLEDKNSKTEKVVETIEIGKAQFEILEKPETILAGKILYAKDFTSMKRFYSAIEKTNTGGKKEIYAAIHQAVPPLYDIHLSVNFWRAEKLRAFGFVRETASLEQPEGTDVYVMPASLYIRAYTNKATAQLLSKDACEIWELFAYLRNFFMPTHNFKMAENGAQEMEVFDTSENKTGLAYMPILRV